MNAFVGVSAQDTTKCFNTVFYDTIYFSKNGQAFRTLIENLPVKITTCDGTIKDTVIIYRLLVSPVYDNILKTYKVCAITKYRAPKRYSSDTRRRVFLIDVKDTCGPPSDSIIYYSPMYTIVSFRHLSCKRKLIVGKTYDMVLHATEDDLNHTRDIIHSVVILTIGKNKVCLSSDVRKYNLVTSPNIRGSSYVPPAIKVKLK